MLWRVRSAVSSINWYRMGAAAVPVVLFLGLFILYLSTQTRYYTYDAVAYATQIRRFAEEGRLGWLFHPHHLLFNVLGYSSWRMLEKIGLDADPLQSLGYMNALFAALGLVLFYGLLRRGGFGLDRGSRLSGGTDIFTAFSATLLLGSTYGYWLCATDGRVTMPGLAAVILVMGLAWGMVDRPGVRQCLAAAGATALAVTLHQSHGLLVVPVVGAIMLSEIALRRRLLLAGLYLSVTFTFIGLIYLGIGVFVKDIHSYSEFNAWVLAYAHDGRWWNFNVTSNLTADARALAHVFSAQLPFSEVLKSWSKHLPAVALIAAMALALCCTLKPRSLLRCLDSNQWRYVLVLLLAAIPYAAFFTVWVPGYFAFWLPVALVIIISAVLVTENANLKQRWILPFSLLTASLALAYYNLPTVLSNMQCQNNPDLVLCDSIREHVKPGDMIIMTGTYQPAVMRAAYAETYLPYFMNVSVKTVGGECKYFNGDTDHAVRSIRGVTRMRMQAGYRVFVFEEFMADDTWQALGRQCGLPDKAREKILDGYRLQPVVSSGKTVAYRLMEERRARIR